MAPRAKQAECEPSVAIFKIQGPPGAVQQKLQKVPGLRKAHVNSVEGTVLVVYDPSVVSEADIKQACT